MAFEPLSNPRSEDEALPNMVPANILSAKILMQRTQKTLAVLCDVVQESSADYWYERGKAASATENRPEAIYAFRRCLDYDVQHWRATLQLAASLVPQQADDAALALQQFFKQPYPGKAEFVAELSKVTWENLRVEFEARKGNSSNGFELLLGLALVYWALQEPLLARQTLDVTQFLYANRVSQSAVWFQLSGLLWIDEKDYFKSASECECAIALDSKNFILYYIMGNSKFGSGDKAEAIINYNKAINFCPNYFAAYHYRGRAKQILEDYAGAIGDYDQAIELKPDDVNSYYERGSVKANLKDYAGAIADYTHVIELEPENAYAYYYRGHAKRKLGEYIKAIADYDCAIRLEKNDEYSYFFRGNTKENLEDYAGAIADYDIAVKLNIEHTSSLLFRADAKGKIGDAAGAAADRARAAQIKIDKEAK